MIKLGTVILIAVANDFGFGADVPLRFAEADAAKVVEAMQALGDVDRVRTAIGGDAHAAQVVLAEAKQDVADARALGEQTLLVFYYSGHADGDFLRVGGTRITWAKLRELIQGTGADLTLAIIDACDSGSATAKKGGAFARPFGDDPIQVQTAKGSMWISSSRSDEASYESDELGGSFFSHFLVSGLRGGADLDEDGRVTLTEAYQFTFDRTVGETSLKLKRTQHPTYRSDLAGEGEIILTEPRRSKTSIVLPRETEGEWFFARRFGVKRSVMEVPKSAGALVRLSVPAGSYFAYKKELDRIMLAELVVVEGEEVVVDPSRLKPHAYADVLEKGGGIAVGAWSARAAAGMASALVEGGAQVFELRAAVSRRGRTFGLGASVSATRFTLQAVDTEIETYALATDVHAELVLDLGGATVALQAGPSALFLHQETERLDRTSLSPALFAAVLGERPLFAGVALALELGVRAVLLETDRERTIRPSVFGSVGLAFSL